MKDRIAEVIEPISRKYGQELVDIVLASNSRGVLIKVSVGSKEGPKVSDLTAITKEFNKTAALTPEKFFNGDYQMEVSSPGIDRELKTFNDFYWNEGRNIKLIYSKDGEEIKAEGNLIKAENDHIIADLDGSYIQIKYEDIVKAKLKIKF
jgi:ribosome maturation factor RimP